MGRKKDLKLNTQHATEDKEIITEKYKEVRDEMEYSTQQA